MLTTDSSTETGGCLLFFDVLFSVTVTAETCQVGREVASPIGHSLFVVTLELNAVPFCCPSALCTATTVPLFDGTPDAIPSIAPVPFARLHCK